MKKVSVVIPVFNGEDFISETIKSVINQSYSNWELIIVDDGSTDDSERIIKEYISEKISYIKRPSTRKKGGNACRNIGIEAATGEYIIFLDADDLLAEYCLEQRIQWLSTHDEVDFAVFNMYRFYDDVENKKVHTILDVNDPLPSFLGLNCLWQTSAPIWNRNFIKNNKFNENYSRLQDPELIIRCLKLKNIRFTLVKDSKPDIYYRMVTQKNRSNLNVKRKVPSNYYNAFEQFIMDFYPIKETGIYFEKSKRSLFLLLSQQHLFANNSSNIPRYKSLVQRLDYKMNLADKLMYKFSIYNKLLLKMRNRFLQSICARYIKYELSRIWGNIYISYK